jgi:hypothetical protein
MSSLNIELDRLLAMENGIFRRCWICRQVDSSVPQVVRRFPKPGCRVGQPRTAAT